MATTENNIDKSNQLPPPPAYSLDPPDITAAFANLNLEDTDKPTPGRCIAHLKLLEAFHQLRCDVATNDGLFGIKDEFVPPSLSEQKHAETLLKIREKRWAIYVAKAAGRFEKWWRVCVEPGAEMLWPRVYGTNHFDQNRHDRVIDKGTLPPLDVVMVWHAYLLNPRDFLEDCVRNQKMNFWRQGMPWADIDSCIDNESFAYVASDEARHLFEAKTGYAWDSLHDGPNVHLECPGCSRSLSVPWTGCSEDFAWRDPGGKIGLGVLGQGFADKEFRVRCGTCNVVINHDLLRAQKFRKDVQQLVAKDVPMPGTILKIDGQPELSSKAASEAIQFPNRLIKKWLSSSILAQTDPRLSSPATIDRVRKVIEGAVNNKSIVRKVNDCTFNGNLLRTEKIAIRRMMSRYWSNSSTFALDLVGAVIRQGSFIEKMHAIDWIHSPTVASTMDRLIVKYKQYFIILATHPDKIAVPTLDVDLAWHTHQLSPKRYYVFSLQQTRKFIDHDDKIDEAKLSDAFTWTSKTYQSMFKSLYSECTCWYCESVRESHTSSLGRIFKSSNGAIDLELDHLHRCPNDTANVHAAPHISAHSSITPTDRYLSPASSAKSHELERNYQKVVQRSKKKGRAPPPRDEHMFYSAYGYPILMPYYAPYMADPALTPGIYPSNPACANFTPGAVGNCCAGACGGGVAAGACGGAGAGGCAGGSAGGCGGGSSGGSGGCGGGGGGGCGGGGGGGC